MIALSFKIGIFYSSFLKLSIIYRGPTLKYKTAPQSPWQNPYVERLIGSIRRDCLNHVIVLNQKHLKQILTSYFEYYHNDRTHCGLDKDTPIARPVQPKPANCGKVIELPRVGGLHHRYGWRQAA